jgi:hypothetical protein
MYIESNRTDKRGVFRITVESPSARHGIQFIALNEIGSSRHENY